MAKRVPSYMGIVVVMALSLVACGDKTEIDTHPTATLRQITRGQLVSKGFRYKLVNPKVEVLNQSLGLVREGNLVEFIGGRGLEEKLKDRVQGSFELAVVKQFSPFVHFKVERIYGEADTTFMTPGAVVYPRLVDSAEFSTQGYEPKSLDEIPYNRTDVLRGLENKKIALTATITRETDQGRAYYLLHGKDVKFRIAETPDGTGLILKLMAQQRYPFEGGVLVTATEEYGSRMRTKIAGTVEVMYVKYGDRVVSG